MNRPMRRAALLAVWALVASCGVVMASSSAISAGSSALTEPLEMPVILHDPDWDVLTGPPEMRACEAVCPVLRSLLRGEELARAEEQVGCNNSLRDGLVTFDISVDVVPSVLRTRYGGYPPSGTVLFAHMGCVMVVNIEWELETRRQARRVFRQAAKDVEDRIGRKPDDAMPPNSGSSGVAWFNDEDDVGTHISVSMEDERVIVGWMCTARLEEWVRALLEEAERSAVDEPSLEGGL